MARNLHVIQENMSTRLYSALSNEDKNEAFHRERTDLMAFWNPPVAFGSVLLFACGSAPKGVRQSKRIRFLVSVSGLAQAF